MKKHRIFLAINLPDEAKKRLIRFQEQWFDLPVRWTKKENLHITLIFIGYVGSEEMIEICGLSKQVISREPCFEIKLNQICFGPPGRTPRMIWIIGENNPDLSRLKGNLEAKLFNLNKNIGNYNNRVFYPHITLARIRQRQWQELPIQPKIEEEISLRFLVASIEIMQSFLSRKGPEYAVLETIPLK